MISSAQWELWSRLYLLAVCLTEAVFCSGVPSSVGAWCSDFIPCVREERRSAAASISPQCPNPEYRTDPGRQQSTSLNAGRNQASNARPPSHDALSQLRWPLDTLLDQQTSNIDFITIKESNGTYTVETLPILHGVRIISGAVDLPAWVWSSVGSSGCIQGVFHVTKSDEEQALSDLASVYDLKSLVHYLQRCPHVIRVLGGVRRTSGNPQFNINLSFSAKRDLSTSPDDSVRDVGPPDGPPTWQHMGSQGESGVKAGPLQLEDQLSSAPLGDLSWLLNSGHAWSLSRSRLEEEQDDEEEDSDDEDDGDNDDDDSTEPCEAGNAAVCRRLRRSIDFEINDDESHEVQNNNEEPDPPEGGIFSWFRSKPRPRDEDQPSEKGRSALSNWIPSWLKGETAAPPGILDTEELLETVRQQTSWLSSWRGFISGHMGSLRREEPFPKTQEEDDTYSFNVVNWARRWFYKSKKSVSNKVRIIKGPDSNKDKTWGSAISEKWYVSLFPRPRTKVDIDKEISTPAKANNKAGRVATEPEQSTGQSTAVPEVKKDNPETKKVSITNSVHHVHSESDKKSWVYQVFMGIKTLYDVTVHSWRQIRTDVSRRWHGFAKEQCLVWYRGELRAPPSYHEVPLPPCRLKEALDHPDFRPDHNCNTGRGYCHFFHRGAYHCILSARASASGHGQQACYSEEGQLLNSTSGGGTFDRSHPDGIVEIDWSSFLPRFRRLVIWRLSHYVDDVWPFLTCCKFTEHCQLYSKVRPTWTTCHDATAKKNHVP